MSRQKTEIVPERVKRLKEIIKSSNLTNKQFAALIGISPQSLSKIINFKVTLTEDTARKICAAFPSYRVSWLLCFDDDKTQRERSLTLVNSDRYTLDLCVSVLARLAGYDLENIYSDDYDDARIKFYKNGNYFEIKRIEFDDFQTSILSVVDNWLTEVQINNGTISGDIMP